MLFMRLDDLTDKLVGKTARGERPFIRWPKEMTSFKKACNKCNAGCVMFSAGALLGLTAILGLVGLALAALASPLTASLLTTSLVTVITPSIVVGGALIGVGYIIASIVLEDQLFCKISDLMEPLLGKDPYLTLGAAAFLTVGAMPEWLRAQMASEGVPDWGKQRLAGEPYTVERAGLDYLSLMSGIGQLNLTPDEWSLNGKTPPPADYRLSDSLKTVVVEIILFLSSLPDSGEEPEEDAVEAVMDAIDRLAAIDGRSFVAAVRDSFMEAKDKEKDDYNSEVMNAVDASMHAQASEAGERSKIVQENMETLRKMSETAVAPAPAVEASDPSQALAAKANAGSKIARELMSQYSALEATALRNGESIEVLRSKFMQLFKAMDDLLAVSEDVKKNSDFYEDPKAISELVLRGEHGLRSKMVEEARLINSGNVLKAQASAAYLSSAN